MAEERKSWLQQQMTLPNIAYVGTIIFAVGMFWSSVQSSNAEQDRRIAAAEQAIGKATADTSTILQAIAELRTDVRYLSKSLEAER